MKNMFHFWVNKHRDVIYNENINFFHALTSILSISYIFLIPNVFSVFIGSIFLFYNIKLLINIFKKSKLDYLNKCKLIMLLIVDSIFIQLPGLIFSTTFNDNYQTIDILSMKNKITNLIFILFHNFLVIIKLFVINIFSEQYISKIYFKW